MTADEQKAFDDLVARVKLLEEKNATAAPIKNTPPLPIQSGQTVRFLKVMLGHGKLEDGKPKLVPLMINTDGSIKAVNG